MNEVAEELKYEKKTEFTYRTPKVICKVAEKIKMI